MKTLEQTIRKSAFARIAQIFNISVDQLRLDFVFGEELDVTFVSDFRDNEHDQVLHDIEDVSDRNVTKELNKGLLTIRTVNDYCNHMVRCFDTMPEEVARILEIQL